MSENKDVKFSDYSKQKLQTGWTCPVFNESENVIIEKEVIEKSKMFKTPFS